MKTIVLAICLCLVIMHLNAQPGTLDQSFGNAGKIVYTLPDNYAQCYASALQADGKIIIAGEAGYGQPVESVFLRRYNADGNVDLNFGDSGNVISNFGYTNHVINAVAVTSDNKIIVAGGCNNLGLDILLARYLPDGSLDSSFGNNGKVDSDLGGWEWARGMALQPDGKILITGRVSPSPIGNFLAARYDENGSLDSSFGTNGRTITDMGGDDQSSCIALQEDGKIIVGGEQAPIDGNGRDELFALARYSSNGILDESFGNKGIVLQNFTDYYDVVNALAIQADGKIIAAGQVNGSYDFIHEYMAAARFNTDGSLDESFGDNGLVTAKYQNHTSNGSSVLIQPDNKIILGGNDSYDDGTISTQDFFIERFLPDGTADISFGINGQAITDMGAYDRIVSMLLQPDNKIVTSGELLADTEPYYTYKIGIARYNNDANKKQIIITKIRRWLQHRNGIMWDNINDAKNCAVQRSGDGVNWSTVHHPQSIVNSQLSTVNYYNDPLPLSGTNYYRLQTTSVDGVVAYSNVIAVTDDASAIKISPNPAKNSLHIEGLSSNAKLTIVDFTGNIKLQAVAKNTSYNFNIASLTTGNYLLKIEMNDEVVTKKFVKE